MKRFNLTIIILILFFFSGCASLIYEVIWARKLGLIFGTTSYAISTILAVFMAGLALGSFLFGKIVDRLKEPKKILFLVGLLGIGEGAYAFFTPFIFRLINQAQLILVGSSNPNPSSLNIHLLRFFLSFLALILPTTFSGGTLPVLSKFLIRFKEEIGEKTALLYSLNTFGGVAGVVLAGFFLIIPLGLGVNGTIYAAAATDILVGLIFLGLCLRPEVLASLPPLRENSSLQKQPETKPKTRQNRSYLLLTIFFFTGFTALALEVLWTRVLILTIGSSTYSFSLILAGFLSGIALGSILVAKYVDKIKNLWFWLALTIFGMGLFVMFLTPLFDDLPFYFIKIFGTFGESFWKFELVLFSLIFFILLLPTVLMGATFSLGSKIYIRDLQKVGSSLGEIYSINTLGCIFGSLVAGFLLLPAFGLQKSILICALIYLFLATVIFLITSKKILFKTIFILIILALGISSFFFPQWNRYILTSGPAVYARRYFFEPENLLRTAQEEKIIFYQDGLTANVSVTQSPQGYLAMRINGKVDASAGKIEFKKIGDLDNMLLTGYLPILLHPKNPQNVLIVGLGSGATLGAMTQYPLKEIDMVEIEPAVVEGAKYFKDFNHDSLNDPRVKVIIEDGRNWLLRTSKKYDIISSQPSNPWIEGMSNLFTKEYYELTKNHLKEKGLMFQWVQLYSLDKEDLKSVFATFSEVFPNVLVWSSPSFKDFYLIGSLEPIEINIEDFRQRFEILEIKNDFQKIGILEPEEILANFIFSQNQIKNFSKDSKLHTDNYPILEFRAPLSLYKETVSGNLEELYSFREVPETITRTVSANLFDFREKNLQAVIAKEKGDFNEAIKFYEEALRIKVNPVLKGELAELYFERGRAASTAGKPQEATLLYQRAAELNPFSPKILNNLGVIYLKQNDFENGEIWLKKATEVGPWYSLSFSNLGLLYLKQEKYDLAENYLKEALKINEKNIDALNWLAALYLEQGKNKEAKELFEKSLRIKPEQPKVREILIKIPNS